MNYTYIVKCSDGTFYTGWTNDLTRRMEAHNQGRGAKLSLIHISESKKRIYGDQISK